MKYLLIIFSVLIFNSCNEKKSETNSDMASSPFFSNETDTLKYAMKEIKFLFPMQKGTIDTTYAIFQYPVYASNRPDIDRFMNSMVYDLLTYHAKPKDAIPVALQKITDVFFQEYSAYLKEKPEYIMSYGMENRIQPMHRMKGIVSLSSYTYSFTGGAHPNHSTVFHNYDIDKKMKMENRAILDLNHRELCSQGEKYFRIQNEVPKDMSLMDQGYFWEAFENHKEGEFYFSDNFGFERDSVLWLYNSYEIASYAAGNPIIKLPKSLVLNYVRN